MTDHEIREWMKLAIEKLDDLRDGIIGIQIQLLTVIVVLIAGTCS